MKVLHLGKFDTLGGIERHVRALASGLAASGEAMVVNLVSNDGPHTDSHHDYGYPTVRAACWGTMFSLALSPTLPWHAWRLHREHRFDLVHLHFPDPLGHFAALALPGAKRVISWHSDIIRQQRALKVYGPFMRRFVRDADALIGATPQHFSASTQIPEPSRANQVRAVIPYGFDPGQMAWTSAGRSRYDALIREASGRRTIFTVGRHVYYKGFDYLIDAMRELDALLWIGGCGPLTQTLQNQARAAEVSDKIVFTGRIPEDELVAYYSACDVFAMPSTDRSEAFGIVQLEAMHCGKPVVSTRLGNGVEFVNRDGETGFLVEPRDTPALVSAISRLLDDASLRQRFGATGRAWVSQGFSMQSMVADTLAVYQQVLQQAK